MRDVIDKWNLRKEDLRKAIAQSDMEEIDYKKLMELIAVHIIGIEKNDLKLQEVDTSGYQGSNGYIFCDSDNYGADCFYTAIAYYGSCSGCDAILGITEYCGGLPDEQQTNEFMSLCLELVQSIKRPYDIYAEEMEGGV